MSHPPSIEKSSIQTKSRLTTIDNLRGVAVILVLLSHYIGHIFPKFLEFQNNHLNFGTIGVEIFFCVSGYVIPYSLVRCNSFNIFWIRRVFRLYPLYLAVAAGAFFLLGNHPSVELATNDFVHSPVRWTLSFLTMSSYYFQHQTPYGGLEWTLTYEMVFYLICSTTYFLIFRKTKVISAKLISVIVSMALFVLVFIPDLFHNNNSIQKASHMYLFFHVGFLSYLYQQNNISKNIFISSSLFTIGMILIRNALWMNYWGPNYMTFAGPFALWIFYSFMFNKIIINNIFLLKVGVSSYSLYLIHIFIPELLRFDTDPMIKILIWILMAISLSLFSYKWIESPCIKMAKILTSTVKTET
jgi:peptidoglycan/LPS O-acetylase OafA/YrhL